LGVDCPDELSFFFPNSCLVDESLFEGSVFDDDWFFCFCLSDEVEGVREECAEDFFATDFFLELFEAFLIVDANGVEELDGVFFVKFYVFGEEEVSGDRVSAAPDDVESVLWGDDLCLYLHENFCFRACFFCLGDMKVHFVSVEICSVGVAHGWVESEGFSWKDFNMV